MFRIEMLPAANGDALLVRYGDAANPSVILIDAGTPGAHDAVRDRLMELKDRAHPLNIELLVITHIDDDHIGGVLALLEKEEVEVRFRDIWFNGYGHLGDEDIQEFGPVQGERLTTLLTDGTRPWNIASASRSLRVRDGESLPTVTLGGGMKVTLLSPDGGKLAKLRQRWEDVVTAEGLIPNAATDSGFDAADNSDIERFGPIDLDTLAAEAFHEDTAPANGSSIAFLAEYDGRRVLFAADAHPGRLIQSIDTLVGPGNKLALDVCKLSHHGSNHNTSPDLIDRLDCTRYLISTNGARFKHPHRPAMARIIKHGTQGKELIFNYRSDYTVIWDDEDLKAEGSYSTTYPPAGSAGIVIDV
jgi:beta-lactamase superfamily II metal-dependent hydrolase